MTLQEKADDLLRRINEARRDALRDFKQIERIKISKEAELILMAGADDVMRQSPGLCNRIMGIPVERVHEGPEFTLITK